MSVYVGFRVGKAKEHKAYISEYYCGKCRLSVSDHDSYCSECGGAFRKEDATERTCKIERDCDLIEDGFSNYLTWKCSCGEKFPYWRWNRPVFCPECRGKVVKDAN